MIQVLYTDTPKKDPYASCIYEGTVFSINGRIQYHVRHYEQKHMEIKGKKQFSIDHTFQTVDYLLLNLLTRSKTLLP